VGGRNIRKGRAGNQINRRNPVKVAKTPRCRRRDSSRFKRTKNKSREQEDWGEKRKRRRIRGKKGGAKKREKKRGETLKAHIIRR